eukprot:Opistho-2@92314
MAGEYELIANEDDALLITDHDEARAVVSHVDMGDAMTHGDDPSATRSSGRRLSVKATEMLAQLQCSPSSLKSVNAILTRTFALACMLFVLGTCLGIVIGFAAGSHHDAPPCSPCASVGSCNGSTEGDAAQQLPATTVRYTAATPDVTTGTGTPAPCDCGPGNVVTVTQYIPSVQVVTNAASLVHTTTLTVTVTPSPTCEVTAAAVAACTPMTVAATPSCGNGVGTSGDAIGRGSAWADMQAEVAAVSFRSTFSDSVNASNIRELLREYTRRPHLAGTPSDIATAVYTRQLLEDAGFEDITLDVYNVLLTYPHGDNKTSVSLIASDNTETWRAHATEDGLPIDGDHNDEAVPPYIAFSPSGNVTSTCLVYVNYCTESNFASLLTRLSPTLPTLDGCVALCRYGSSFRGNKVSVAEQHNISAVLIFSDPAEVAHDGDALYPDGASMGPDGVQRGSLYMAWGDPQTPYYPARPGVYRTPIDSPDVAAVLPRIPAHPLSYRDAAVLLDQMGGPAVPSSWVGGIPGVTYRLGGQLTGDVAIRVVVSSNFTVAPIANVCGSIRGSVEPDRVVIMGNHRDAWVYGGADPSSGTAAMMEAVRVFGELRKGGWQPRRTLTMCSWDAEEFGLIGSSEYCEDYAHVLSTDAVAYLNIDIAVEGTLSLSAKAAPILRDVLFDAARSVRTVGKDAKGSTVHLSAYQAWLSAFPDADADYEPNVPILGSGSDFIGFYQHLGIPSMDMKHVRSPKIYPLYHSMHDGFAWLDKLDPGFAAHTTVVRVWGATALRLLDARALPLNAITMAKSLLKQTDALAATLSHGNEEDDAYTDAIHVLRMAVVGLKNAANAFHQRLAVVAADENASATELRRMNDRLAWVERALVAPEGLPGRPWYRHLVNAPSALNSYSGSGFPGAVDAHARGDADQTRRALARVTAAIVAAARSLDIPDPVA